MGWRPVLLSIEPASMTSRRQVGTVERDKRVLSVITDAGAAGLTRQQIADRSELAEHVTYQSMYRLMKNDLIARHKRIWYLTPHHAAAVTAAAAAAAAATAAATAAAPPVPAPAE